MGLKAVVDLQTGTAGIFNTVAIGGASIGGNALAVTGTSAFGGAISIPGGTAALLTTTSTATSGAGAQVGTLLNAPAAGNPTSWLKVIDGGVTRYIPAW